MQADLLASGDVRLTIATVVVLVACGAVEALLRRRHVVWFHLLAFPSGIETTPLLRAPRGAGRSRGIDWRVVDEGRRIVFHTDGPGAPRGLHGTALLRSDRHGRVHLDVRWAPAWTPLVALAWLSVLGTSRGEARLVIPLSLLLAFLVLAVNAQVAPAVVAALGAALRDEDDARQGQSGRPS